MCEVPGAGIGAPSPPGGFVLGAPQPRLRAHVDRYIGYAERTEVPLVRREPAGGSVVLVIGWDSPLSVVDPRSPAQGIRAASFVAGMFDAYVTTSLLGVGRGVELLLSPLVAGRLLGLPLGELANRAVALDDLPGRWLRELPARLAGAPDWPSRFAALDAALSARLAATRPEDSRVAWAWRRMADAHGRVAVGGLAADLGWSRRHFAAVFRREIGLPPKTTARVLRFERARSRLDRVDGGWAAVAADCGYFDQSHLIRDFREFAGATPGAYRRSSPARPIGDE